MNGKHFKVKDMMPGENAPPLHPHCRCSTAAYEDDAEYEAWMQHLESGGTTAEWNKLKGEKAPKGETEKQFGVLYGDDAKDVNWDYIDSAAYKSKFSQITNNQDVNDSVLSITKKMLRHCDGTEHEDLYLLGMDGQIIAKVTDSVSKLGINYSDEFKEALERTIADGIPVIAIHNHPHGTPPSPDDLMKAYENKYGIGIVTGHNGQVYTYQNSTVNIALKDADTMAEEISFFYEQGYDIDRASKMVYNGNGLDYTILEGVE